MPAWFAAMCGLVFAGAADAQPAGNGSAPIAAAVVRHAGDMVAAARMSVPPSQADAYAALWCEATRSVLPGLPVRVILADGSSLIGLFGGADDRGLILSAAGADQRVDRADVARLSVSRGTLRKRRESIGMAIGAAIGAWIGLRQCGPRDNCQEDAMLYFGGPIIAGGVVANMLPAGTAWRDVYRRDHRNRPMLTQPGKN